MSRKDEPIFGEYVMRGHGQRYLVTDMVLMKDQRDGKWVSSVLYHRSGEQHPQFVREQSDFRAQFERVIDIEKAV